MKRLTSGFTLIELVVVIVVIGILASISVVSYRGIQERAQAVVMNTAVDQWEKTLALQLTRRMPSITMNGSYGWSTCLGRSAADFPAQDGFSAGNCLDISNVPGISDEELDIFVESYASYTESFFTDESWWETKEGAFNGLTPVNRVVFSNGTVLRARGIKASIEPWGIGGFWGRSTDQVKLQWMVASDKVSCGKGYVAGWAEELVAQASPGATTVSGRVCELIYVYRTHSG